MFLTAFPGTHPATAAAQEMGRGLEGGGAPATFVHETWTVQEGLPVNSVTALVQGTDGYIWIATFDGLVRFDGVRFTVYSTRNVRELPSNRIVDLIGAPDGSLWMRTEQRHLIRFREGTFTHLDAAHGLTDNTTRVIHRDPVGTIWVGTEDGLGHIAGDRFVRAAEGTIRGRVTAIADAADGGLWVTTIDPPAVFHYAGETAPAIAVGRGLGGNHTTLYEDPSGTLWIGTLSNVYRYRDGEIDELPSLDGPWNEVHEFLAAPSTNALWIRTKAGTYRLHEGRLVEVSREGQIVRARDLLQTDREGRVWYADRVRLHRERQVVYEPRPDRGDPTGRAGEVSAFLFDHEGSVWIGTHAAGLHRLKPSPFTVYSEPEGVAHRNVYTVYQDRSGALWFGTWGYGLSRLAAGAITNFTPAEGYPGWAPALLQDRAGRLWMGLYTGGGGVMVCSLPELSCAPPTDDPTTGESVHAIAEDAAGNIWIGSAAGVFRRDETGWTRFTEADGAPRAVVRVFEQTRDGAVWMGTNGGGLFRYRHGRISQVGRADGVPGDLIRSLYEDADGWLWVGTEGHGLVRLDPGRWEAIARARAVGAATPRDRDRPSLLTVYRSSDGLFDDFIHQILEDDFGRLWMSTNRGIFWVWRAELNAFVEGEVPRVHSTGYTERDGLRNREANGGFQPAGVKARDGRLWFPTQDGAVVVDPKLLSRNEVPPPVAIERLVVRDRSIRPGALPVELAADERDLQIEYTALSFMAPENVRFRYILEGYDSEWIEAGNRRTAFYTKVPPGNYSFRVVASNNAGVWNEEGAALDLSVAPHFYETGAARVLLAATLAFLAAGAVQWRVRNLRQRERELSRLVAERTDELRRHEAQLEAQNAQLEAQAEKLAELDRAKSRFFANVSHEFRTPLTLTIGPLEDLRSELHGPLSREASAEIGLALRNARRLLRLVNQILDVSKLEAGQLRPRIEKVDVAELARRLGESFAPLAERKRIVFRVAIPERVVDLYADSDLLEKVLTNLLSNAFKFTPEGGSVILALEVHGAHPDGRRGGVGGPEGVGTDAPGEVAVAVRDSGPGIHPEALSHIFERFYQVEASSAGATSSSSPGTSPDATLGTGIGLSLAKELVELHGGRIEVESEPGFGSTFRAVFRRGKEHLDPAWFAGESGDRTSMRRHDRRPDDLAPEVAGGEATAPPSASPGDDRDADHDRTTLLVVDDNPDVRRYVRRHLERTYRVLEAGDGERGLRVATEELPDMVIADVVMPGMDGLELCSAIKSDPALDFIPVILLTARASGEHKVEGLRQGADDYVTKPFDFAELEARIDNLVRSRQRLRDRLRKEAILQPEEPDVGSADELFLAQLRKAVEAHIDDEGFDVERLAAELGYSRSSLYRRLDGIIDESPAEIIHAVRLERGRQLLEAEAGNVSEIAYAVGYKSVSHFSRRFRQRFGIPPSAHRAGRGE